jgi:hypothetical protein
MEMWLKHFSFRSVKYQLPWWIGISRNGPEQQFLTLVGPKVKVPAIPRDLQGVGGVVTNDWCIINSDWLLFLQEGNEEVSLVFQNMY